MKDALGHGSDPRGTHAIGVNEIGKTHLGRPTYNLPPRPGTAPIPPGSVRLYHQTREDMLGAIKHNGIELSKAKGIEGPRAIYADEKGFYGNPTERPTVEFAVPKERWDAPFVRADSVLDQGKVAPKDIIAVHYPWHEHARYIEKNPKLIREVVAGEHDNLLNDKTYGKALRFIKHKYGSPLSA